MDIADLEAQQKRLIFAQFSEATALELGLALVTLAKAGQLPVAINIRTPDRTLFHASMPGATPLNDLWARRKSNTALIFQAASMLVTLRLRDKPGGWERNGFAAADFALSGGSVPIRVQGIGVIGAVTVSGLPEAEDHALVVQAIESLL